MSDELTDRQFRETIFKVKCPACDGRGWKLNCTAAAQADDKDALIRLLEQQLKTAREKALEEAAQVAERDVDWSAFGKAAIEPWEKGQDSLRDYRLGIVSGRAIAAAIRSLGEKE